MGLRTRLLLLVLLAAIPALLLALVADLRERKQETLKISRDAMRIVQLAAAKELGLVEATRQHLLGISKYPAALGTNIAVFDAFFALMRKQYPTYSDFGLIETNGQLVASAFGRKGETNLAARADLRRVLEAREFAVGDYQDSNSLTKASLLFGHPVFNTNGQLARVLYGALDSSVIQEAVASSPLPPGGVIHIIDQAGRILVTHPKSARLASETCVDWPLWQSICSKGEGTAELPGLDSIARLYAFTTVRCASGAGLYLAAGVPIGTVNAETDRVLTLNLAVLGLVAATTLLVTYLYANNSILRPVKVLADTTREVALGNLAARTGLTGRTGELGDLARAFDFMAATLQKQRADMELSQEALRQSEQRVLELNAELEDRVRKRTAQLEQAFQELEAFSYSVSHDLRAPLRPIHGYVEMLQHELGPGLNDESRRLLTSIASAAKRMGNLIDNLLAFSRMGQTEMRQGAVSMDALLQEVLQEIKAEVESRDLNWQIGPLPEVVGDRSMLKQVWVNLVSNAAKYTRHRSPADIRIRCQPHEHEFEFSVADNGAGFDMRYAAKLFGVFQRLHHAQEFEGTGIGLANVRRIISRHGGRVWATGQVDGGATFFFTLPRHAVKPGHDDLIGK